MREKTHDRIATPDQALCHAGRHGRRAERHQPDDPGRDVYGIIGMSGAGKSTLVRCINMLERPDEGNVIVNGKQMQDLRAADLRAARREITMIFSSSTC